MGVTRSETRGGRLTLDSALKTGDDNRLQIPWSVLRERTGSI